MTISVLGTGYVGLVSGVCLAAKGHDVTCVEMRQGVVDSLNAGRPHIHEEGLPHLLRSVLASGRFRATTSVADALERSDLVLICVGTPSEEGRIELRYIEGAVRQVGAWLAASDRFLSVVIKSTVIPGTTDTFVRRHLEESSGKRLGSFGLGMNPEFLREGNAVDDFLHPDRVVLGHEDERTLLLLEELYSPWECDKLRVNTRTAELIKYANNCLLATQISAVNELANLATALGGVDIMDVIRGVQLDKRWNPIGSDGVRIAPAILSYLIPGCGFGGSCFPKDVQALRSQGIALGAEMRMLNAVLETNEEQPRRILETSLANGPNLQGCAVIVLGLAFKPGTDDVRESASIKIVNYLCERACTVTVHDPVAIDNFLREAGPELRAKLTIAESWEPAVAQAQVVVVATAWPEYRRLAELDLTGKVLIDARRMFAARELSGTYRSVGYRDVHR